MRGRSALILKILAIVGPLLLIYWQDLEIVAGDALNSEVMNYILIIPFFIAYALYRKRRMLQAVMPLENSMEVRNTEAIVGLSLLLIALILYWHGSYTFYPVEYHLISMPIFLTGTILLIYNWQTLRQLIFPLVMLLLLEPLPLQVSDMIGFQISALSSIAAYSLLKFFGLPVELTTMQTPIITVDTIQGTQVPLVIDVACSGLYLLTGFAAFAVFAAFVMRGPTWKRAILFSFGFPMIYGMNILRIAGIVWIAYGWGEGAAMQTFHLLGGSVINLIASFLLLILGEGIGKLNIFTSKTTREKCQLCNESLMKGESFCPYCGTFLKSQQQNITGHNMIKIIGVIAIALLIVSIQIPSYALDKGTASIDLNTFSPEDLKNKILPTIPGWDLEFLYRDTNIEYMAKWDAALVYYYRRQGSNGTQSIIFVLIQIMKVRHTWEGSLYNWPAQHNQPTATRLEEMDIRILDNPRITGKFLEFIRMHSTDPEVVVYWIGKAQFTVNNTLVSRYISISLNAYPGDLTTAGLIREPSDVNGIQALLLPMAQSIAEYWEPMKSWNLIQISLGQWAWNTLAMIALIPIIMIALLFLKLQSDRNRNVELYQRLKLPKEKGILEALCSRKNTGKTIEAKYRNLIKKDIESRKLVEMLKELMGTGLVQVEIANSNDDPILVWKRRF